MPANTSLSEFAAELEADGITPDIAAASCRRVYALVVTKAEPPEEEPGPGWLAAARYAMAMFGEAGETDITLSFRQLAGMLHGAFCRAEQIEDDAPGFEALPAAAQAAWVGVARHLSNLLSMDDKEARRLGQHEQKMAELTLARLP